MLDLNQMIKINQPCLQHNRLASYGVANGAHFAANVEAQSMSISYTSSEGVH